VRFKTLKNKQYFSQVDSEISDDNFGSFYFCTDFGVIAVLLIHHFKDL